MIIFKNINYILFIIVLSMHFNVSCSDAGADPEVVIDKKTGLVWTKCSAGVNNDVDDSPECDGRVGKYSWEEALQLCKNLNLGDYNWRLPNIRELQSIVLYRFELSPMVDEASFPNAIKWHYWSSTTYARDSLTTHAYTIDFTYGNVALHQKSDDNFCFIRCVAGP